MSEFKFKIGDKVRLTATCYPDGKSVGVFEEHKTGDEFVVMDIWWPSSDLIWSGGDAIVSIDNAYNVSQGMLELVEEEFKCQVEPDNPCSRPEQESRPPLGLKPRKIHNQQRIQEIVAAISRYTEVNKEFPVEWIEEYNDLVKKENV